mmetsp:Transcript_8078/g.23895  ORF Transcript_8078/g.23895 Transcript_8078/m.23895 type:complete len:517 (+) Transcript_8078:418-1968(+)
MADLFEDSEFQFHSLSLSSSLGRQQQQLREQQQQHSNSSNNNRNNNNNNTNDWQEILRTASNDSSSCLSNLSASWIDLEGHPNQPAADHFGIDSSSTNTNTNDVFRPLQHIVKADDGDDFDADTNVDDDVDVDADVDFFDALEVDPSSAQPESVGGDAKFTNDERDRAQATTVRDSPNHPELVEQIEAENETTEEDDDPYVDVQQTCTEHVEGYDWEGILDLRRRLLGQQQKKQKQQQQQQQQQQQRESRQEQQQQQGRREQELSTSAAVRYVTNGSLYLTGDDDLLLEEASSVVTQALERDRENEALRARADSGDEAKTTTERTNQSAATDHGVVGNGHDEDKDENEIEDEDEIAFRAGPPCPRIPVQEKETDPIQHGGHQASTAAADDDDDDDEQRSNSSDMSVMELLEQKSKAGRSSSSSSNNRIQRPGKLTRSEVRQKCIAALRQLSSDGRISPKQKRVLLTDIISSSARGEQSLVEHAYKLLCVDPTDEAAAEEDFVDQCQVFAQSLFEMR